MKKPASAVVFGILNIVLGALALLSLPITWMMTSLDNAETNPVVAIMEGNDFYFIWTKLSLILGGVASVVLVASGIGLLTIKRWARITAVGYSLYSLFMALVGSALSWFYLYSPLLERIQSAQNSAEKGGLIGGLAGGLLGGCFGLFYPAVLLYFMTRPRLVAAFEGTPVPEATTSTPVSSPVVDVSPPVLDRANPYASPTTPLRTRSEGSPDTADEVLATVIPYRNKAALISYYLGLFSLFALVPVLGVVGVGMAIAAFILGLKGRRFVKEHPEAKGTAHAWVGILGGAIWGVLGILMQVMIIIAILRPILR